jgi:hypothetical protein
VKGSGLAGRRDRTSVREQATSKSFSIYEVSVLKEV